MTEEIGCDSLAFISDDGLYRAMGYPQRNALQPQFCDACFTGDYPIRLTDKVEGESGQKQLNLLAEG